MSIMTAVVVIGFVIDAMLKMVSRVIGFEPMVRLSP
jgi:hypothetical protein